MAIFNLLYTSECLIPPADIDESVEAIVETAKRRNLELGITGCLILSRDRFAQILEGDQAAVELLMDSILRDSRHQNVQILDRGKIAKRRFPGWAMRYAGASRFVRGTIEQAAIEARSSRLSGRAKLQRLMIAFRAE